MLASLEGFSEYIAHNFSGAFTIVIGSLITEIVKKIVNDIVLPLSKGQFKTVNENVILMEYIAMIINFIVTVYILYNISEFIKR